MAKVRNNIFVRGLSGNLGNQFVVRTSKNGRTTVAAKTDFEYEREYSEAQLEHRQDFREAILYAQTAQVEEIYRLKANGSGRSPYNMAIADWFHAPEVKGVDLSGWRGMAGDLVRVQAYDDIKVKHVIVRFSDEVGALLEEGSATYVGAQWWEYTTVGSYTGAITVTATAVDLPGNMAEMSAQKVIMG